MIRSYTFRVNANSPIPSDRAYAFYSALLSLLPADYGEFLHQQGETPITQHLYEENGETLWRVHLLDHTEGDAISTVLDRLETISLYMGEFALAQKECASLTAENLMRVARGMEVRRYVTLRVLSPTAFKQAGRYVVLPEIELILQSLVNKWNAVFPSYPMEDQDAIRMLADGIRISDYRLRTTRFHLKDNRIPGFVGNLSFDTQLSAPIMELWKLLLVFSERSGIGIKTALGMGGVLLAEP